MTDKQSLFEVNNLHSQQERVKKFFNRPQREAMIISAHDEYHVAARGVGKSEGLDARFIIRNVWAMPGSTGALISPTYAKAWGNTLPAICHALSVWGYIEGVHYYVGRQAPPSANFKKPKRPPLRDAWSNCLHFWNGTIMVVLSFNNGMSANSMSLDWLIGPEAKFLDYDKIKSEVNPANRGNRQYFDDCPWHHSVLYSTDMPTSKRGKWILDKEKEMNVPHIALIRYLYNEKKRLEALPEQNEYTKRKLSEAIADLAIARRYQPSVIANKNKPFEYTVFYGEYDIFDNLEVVGEDFIWQMHRDSPPLVWRTAFLNERLMKVPDGFYSALEDCHFYMPEHSALVEHSGVNWNKVNFNNCLSDGDVDFTLPIHIAFDSNSAISTAVLGQKINGKMRVISSFYVKTPDKLSELVKAICNYYMPKIDKAIILYYDHTFTWTTGTNSESYCDTIVRVFEENRYSVNAVYVGQAARHEWKHTQIDMALKGHSSLLPIEFNEIKNENLRLAMDQCGVRQGKDGFEKDKSTEKIPDTPDTPDENKPHFTDAFDTLFIGMNFFYAEASSGSGGAYFLKN